MYKAWSWRQGAQLYCSWQSERCLPASLEARQPGRQLAALHTWQAGQMPCKLCWQSTPGCFGDA